MTLALFDLTEHTQMSIRGTTGTHPDSEFVFGIHIGTDEVHAEQLGFTPDITAYDDMDWSKAVELAKWVMSKDGSGEKGWTWLWITENCLISRMWDNEAEGTKFSISIETRLWKFPRGGFEDKCEWERAVQMAKWILEWDERFKGEKE